MLLTKAEQRRRLLQPITRGGHTVSELADLLVDGHSWRDVARLWGLRRIEGARDLLYDAELAWERAGHPGGIPKPETSDYRGPEWAAWRSARDEAVRAWVRSCAGKTTVTTERTPDGHAQVWLLYRPEPHHPDSPEEREMNLWVRRCDVFTDRATAMAFLDTLVGAQVQWERYADLTGGWFPELWVGRRGQSRWWLAPAPLNPPGRDA